MNILTRKLEGLAELNDDDRALLDDVVRVVRDIPSKTDFMREGDRPEHVHLILDGLACRYKVSKEGKRTIMAFLVPGDFCDLHVAILGEMDHSLGTLSPVRLVDIPRSDIERLLNRPAIAKALWWATLVDEGTLREWLVNVGSRDGSHSVAHLFCEIYARMEFVGLAKDGVCHFPLTQEDLAQTVGMSAVHANRSIQDLRARQLIKFDRGRLTILDRARLIEYSGFNPNYLHREKRVG